VGGPPALHVDPDDGRALRDETGVSVVLAGSHHWDSVQRNAERPAGLDFERFLDLLVAHGHTATKLWTHEAWVHDLEPTQYPRRGGRFDLERVNPEFLDRLEDRVRRCAERGLYAIVMLFQGWSIHDKGTGAGDPWPHHPLHRGNNLQGIDGDPHRLGSGVATHTLTLPAVLAVQARYVRAVLERTARHAHVLYEISNESPGSSWTWQRHWIGVIRRFESERRTPRHLVGLTRLWPGGTNSMLERGGADWVSYGFTGRRRASPPPANGRVVSLLDSDHLWGIGGDARWVRFARARGHHVLYLDPLDETPAAAAVRAALGEAAKTVIDHERSPRARVTASSAR
jgi:hypothetical protein